MAGIERDFGERIDQAIEDYLTAISLGEELVQKHPNNARYLDILAKCYKDLAVVYDAERFPYEQVLECNRKALAINRRLVAENSDVPEYHRNLARILHNLGVGELKRGNNGEAEKFFRESLSVRNGMTRFADPPEFHYGKAQTLFAMALSYVVTERFDDADREFVMALQLLDELQELHPDRFGNDELNMQGMILFGLGEMNFRSDRPDVACSYFVRALQPFGILVEKSPEHIGYQRQLNDALSLLFDCLVRENKDDEAIAIFRQREESLLETAIVFPDVIQFLCQWYLRVAEFHFERGRKDEAVRALQNGFEPLDVLEDDRTAEEEMLWEKIRTRLREIVNEE